MRITTWEKSIWKCYILYDSNYMTFWKKQNYGDSKNIRGCQGLWGGEREMNRWSAGDFSAVKIHCNSAHTSPTFVQAHRIYKQASTPNCGLWVIMMGQCRFITFTILVEDVNNGNSSTIVRLRGIWEISGPSIQFCC